MINLGDKVKDKVSGFTGIAVGKTEWLYGCVRFNIQPPIDKDGKLPEMGSFDEPQLEVIGSKKGSKSKKQTGGYDFSIKNKVTANRY